MANLELSPDVVFGREYLRMVPKNVLDKPLDVTIKQKLVFDCFELEEKGELWDENVFRKTSLVHEVSKTLNDKVYFENQTVRSLLEDLWEKKPPRIPLPAGDKGNSLPPDYNKRPLHVSVLIPKDIANGTRKDSCPVHVRFHGGGLVAGSTDYAPWFSYHTRNLSLDANAITLLPSYYKLPEHTGKEIMAGVMKFWDWFQSDKFESEMKARWRKISMDTKNLLVSGESAGGFLAAWSWLSEPKLRIKALYLQYPMLRAYSREGNEKTEYRGKTIKEIGQENVERCAKALVKRRDDQIAQKTERDDSCINSVPPRGMDAAFALPMTRIIAKLNGEPPAAMSNWKYLFRSPDIFDAMEAMLKNITLPDHEDPEKDPEEYGILLDCPTPVDVHIQSSLVKPGYCPSIFISHGQKDKNVPIQDSPYFLKLVETMFPNPHVSLHAEPGAAHAYDYLINEWGDGREWLKQMKDDIVSCWLAGDENKDRIAEILARQAQHPINRSEGTRTAFDIFPDEDTAKTHSCAYNKIVLIPRNEIDFQYEGSCFLDKFNSYVNSNWKDHVARIKQHAGTVPIPPPK